MHPGGRKASHASVQKSLPRLGDARNKTRLSVGVSFRQSFRGGMGRVTDPLILLVGVRGFEPPTPSSRTRCATRLRYTPTTPSPRSRAL